MMTRSGPSIRRRGRGAGREGGFETTPDRAQPHWVDGTRPARSVSQHPGTEGLVANRWGRSSQAQPVGQTDTGQRRRAPSPSAQRHCPSTPVRVRKPRPSGVDGEAWACATPPAVPVPKCGTCSSAAVARWRRGRALRCAPARAAAMETGLCVAEEGPERAGAAGPAPARGEGGRGGRGRARGRDETKG